MQVGTDLALRGMRLSRKPKEVDMKKNLFNTASLVLGLSSVLGLMSLNGFASIPSAGKVTDDTLIYDNLQEISVKKEHEVNFDSDLSRLSAMEKNYKERKLPSRKISYQTVSKKRK